MIHRSIQIACRRLISAREALKRYGEAEAQANKEEAKRHWTDFLMALSSIYNALLEGGNCCGSCKGWMGKQLNLRDKDPLMHYLHQARNSVEHALEESVAYAPQIVFINPKPGENHVLSLSFEMADQQNEEPTGFAKIEVGYHDGRVEDVTDKYTHSYSGSVFVLTTVTNSKFGDTFRPPKEHLGKPLGECFPSVAGQLGIAYCERMIEEARARRCK